MKPWQFRQKTAGYGISKQAYLTVLAAKAQLPVLSQILHPRGEAGAVEGFLAPLAQGSTKEDLQRPLSRGMYAASTRDRKTVIRLVAIPKEEAGFDPEPFLRSSMATSFSPEVVQRVSATWTLLQLAFESHDPMVLDSLKFWLKLAARLADLTEGVVADPISQTYKLPGEVFVSPQADARVDARDHVQVHIGGGDVYTLGASKFNFPEIEVKSLTAIDTGRSLLISLVQSALLGKPYAEGDQIPTTAGPLLLAPGGLDRGRWDGIPCLELLPPTGVSIDQALGAWARASS